MIPAPTVTAQAVAPETPAQAAFAVLDDVAILMRLVEACQLLLRVRAPSDSEQFGALIQEVSKRVNRPAPDGRVFDRYTALMATAACEAACALHDHKPEQAGVYFQIIGVVLPCVRQDLARAFEIRKRPTP